jgi:hypothetical protein
MRQVKAALGRHRNCGGVEKLERVFVGDVRVALSKLERRFLELLHEAGLPLPVTNKVADGRRVDCRWPDYKLTVELISYRYHHTRYAWEQDRLRARDARKRGDRFREYTWADVFEDPREMLAELRELLSRPLA